VLRALAAKSCSGHFHFDIQARDQINDLTKNNRYRATNFLYNPRHLLLNCLRRVSDFKLRLQLYIKLIKFAGNFRVQPHGMFIA
jgi:hypothetical protein